MRLREADIDDDAWLDLEPSDLLDLLDGAVQVDDTLVESHLKFVPGVATFTAWGLAAGDPQGLGGNPYWSSELVVHIPGLLNDLAAHILQGLHLLGRQSQSIALMNAFTLSCSTLLVLPHPSFYPCPY